MHTVQDIFEDWCAGSAPKKERELMFRVDENGDYKLMQIRTLFNGFMAGFKAAESKAV